MKRRIKVALNFPVLLINNLNDMQSTFYQLTFFRDCFYRECKSPEAASLNNLSSKQDQNLSSVFESFVFNVGHFFNLAACSGGHHNCFNVLSTWVRMLPHLNLGLFS